MDDKNMYGYCANCQMELVYMDSYSAPPGMCSSCYGLEFCIEYHEDAPVPIQNIPGLWEKEDEQS